MSVQNGLFDNVMTDVSGKVRLESEDPRWIQLFSTKTISQLSAEEVGWYAARLIEHNPATGNLIQMLDQTSSKLQQVTPRRTSPPSQLTEQCCSALFLTTLLLHHIIAHSSLHEVSTHQLSVSHCFTFERSLLKILYSYYGSFRSRKAGQIKTYTNRGTARAKPPLRAAAM
jgi:hypothetical protein